MNFYILFTSIMDKLLFNLVFINAPHDITITYFVLATIGLDFVLNTISLDNYYVFCSIWINVKLFTLYFL